MFFSEDLDIDKIIKEFQRNGVTQELDDLDKLMRDARVRSFQNSCTNSDPSVFNQELDGVRKTLACLPALKNKQHCVFCKNNREMEAVYTTHVVKNRLDEVTCPILTKYTCPKCGATGKRAHTIKYCPLNDDGQNTVEYLLNTPRNGSGRLRIMLKS